MTEAAPAHALRRDPANGIVAGVCAGLARQLGVDPLLVRAAFVGVTFAGGLGIALYGLAWMLLPADEGTSVLGRRQAGVSNQTGVPDAARAKQGRCSRPRTLSRVHASSGYTRPI